MIKDFQTYINEGLFDRSQSEFGIRKTDKGIEQLYIPKTRDELHSYIDIDIENARKVGTYPNVNLNNIDVSELRDGELDGLFGDDMYKQINPDISNWNIKYIPNKFFDNNEQIKEFTISSSVTSIEDWSFACCRGLTSIEIPNSVTSIGYCAFEDCSSLHAVTIPDSVIDIGNYAFYNCKGLTSVTIGNSVTSIGEGTFYGCDGLSSIEIPDSVTKIVNGAFFNCGSLTSATISKNCNIGASAFPKNCKITRRDD